MSNPSNNTKDDTIPLLQMRKLRVREMKALAQGHTDRKRQSQDIRLNYSSFLHPRLLFVPQGHVSEWTAFRAQSLLSKFVICTYSLWEIYLRRKGKSQQSAVTCHFCRLPAKVPLAQWKICLECTLQSYPYKSKEKLENTSKDWSFLWKFLCRFLSSVDIIWHCRAKSLNEEHSYYHDRHFLTFAEAQIWVREPQHTMHCCQHGLVEERLPF